MKKCCVGILAVAALAAVLSGECLAQVGRTTAPASPEQIGGYTDGRLQENKFPAGNVRQPYGGVGLTCPQKDEVIRQQQDALEKQKKYIDYLEKKLGEGK